VGPRYGCVVVVLGSRNGGRGVKAGGFFFFFFACRLTMHGGPRGRGEGNVQGVRASLWLGVGHSLPSPSAHIVGEPCLSRPEFRDLFSVPRVERTRGADVDG
jgi:hypothetical protein